MITYQIQIFHAGKEVATCQDRAADDGTPPILNHYAQSHAKVLGVRPDELTIIMREKNEA